MKVNTPVQTDVNFIVTPKTHKIAKSPFIKKKKKIYNNQPLIFFNEKKISPIIKKEEKKPQNLPITAAVGVGAGVSCTGVLMNRNDAARMTPATPNITRPPPARQGGQERSHAVLLYVFCQQT